MLYFFYKGVKIMKKFKKYILLIMALNMCFFAYESEKREAEAFAMSTAALVLGGLAIVGGGARTSGDCRGRSHRGCWSMRLPVKILPSPSVHLKR